MATRTGPAPDIGTRQGDLPSILAIVVTHNGRTWLRDCLVSLASQSYKLLDVLVVDDATIDAREQPQIRRIAKRHLKRRRWGYLRTPRPLGFGGAVNWAMSRVRTDADMLLFIHDDAALDRTSVEHMVSRMLADDNTGIVGPKVVAWDDPQRLEEVGMLIDRFGYPYKGLEEGEIDLGQHDSMSEVFYVTSTCMLVKHDVFKKLRGWDSRMLAYSEDLDLCWRTRLLGHAVRVEPRATARHAVAMARGTRPSPFVPSRYYIRRNRMRTVFKNASGIRLAALAPLFLVLALSEMIGFVVLRQPREILNLARALLWNFARLPQTLAERRKVQGARKVSDLKLNRLTVKESKRVRFYISHQRDLMEEIWGRRAELFARRSSQARLLGMQLRGWLGLALILFVIALLLGFRNIWWNPQLAVGEVLPFPDRATGLWRAFVAPWRGAGLGQSGPNPPALAILGFFPILTLGGAAAAQKMLFVVLGVVAFIGAYRLVSDSVDRTGRLAAGAVYMFGPVGYAGIRSGSLGALVFGAAAPYVLHEIVRIAAWARPPAWSPSRSVARVALGAAISAAFIPGSLILYASAAVALTMGRSIFVRTEKVTTSALQVAGGLFVGWLLLLPWSAGWFSEGAPLEVLRSAESWRIYAASFGEAGVLETLLGQVPQGPVLFGLALPLLGLIAAVVGEGQRRRLALIFWFVIALVGLFTTSFSIGWLRPFVASPVEAGVLVQACFAGLVGLAVGAFKLDLPRRGFGLIQGGALFLLAASAAMLVAGFAPAVWHGDWGTGKGSDRENEDIVAQVGSLFEAESQAIGEFRALWVGEGWTSPIPLASRPSGAIFVTGSRGQVMTDLFQRSTGGSQRQFERVIDSVRTGSTDRGGSLLGAFNIHMVVVERSADATAWLTQRDLALVRSEADYLVLRNDAPLSRAGLYTQLPEIVTALDEGDPTIASGMPQTVIETFDQRRSYEYVGQQVSTPGTVFLAEASDDGWTATIDGEALERTNGGWGNAFVLPSGRDGRLEITYPRRLGAILWLVAGFLAWIVVVGASFSRRRRAITAPRTSRKRGASRRVTERPIR